MSVTGFDAEYYRKQIEGSMRSARSILPLLLERFTPQSAIDVGCGTGAWLSVLKELGVRTVQGLDASDLPSELRCITDAEYRFCNLSAPLDIQQKFDLAISVEVAEHLSPERAAGFVADLTALANVVLFSAAVPFQGGNGHRNENWPDFWNRLFQQRGYAVCDFIRPRIWNDSQIAVWYRQNLFVFVRRKSPYFQRFDTQGPTLPLSIIHPEIYFNAIHNRRRPSTRIDDDIAHFYSMTTQIGGAEQDCRGYGDDSLRRSRGRVIRTLLKSARRGLQGMVRSFVRER